MRTFAALFCVLISSAISQTAQAQVIYSPTIGGTYLPLAGATVKGKLNVILQGCPATAPWKFSIDTAAVINTESGCPYGLIDDEKLWDSASITDGLHTLKATPASGTPISATFTVANSTPIPPQPPVVTGNVTITWIAPTQNTDGSPITLPLSYSVEENGAQVGASATTTLTLTGVPAGHHCYAVRATAGGTSDPSSPPACADVSGTNPPPLCTHPASPPTSQVLTCPAGTIGNWTQTRTCTESACPAGGGNTTWTCGAWIPAAPPAGVCATPPPVIIKLACSLSGQSANYANGDEKFTLRCPTSPLAKGDAVTVTRP